jgi:hypothetical protein
VSQVVSFQEYTPPARFDSVAWSEIRIEESDTDEVSTDTVWTQIDAITITPVDPDPSQPAARSFSTPNGSDTLNLWYRVIYADASSDTSPPTDPVQNLPIVAYATTTDLFRILKKRDPSDAEVSAAQGDLDTATIEINTEIDWADDHPPATADQLELLRGVCLDRAADLWRHRESAPGILGVVDEGVPSAPGRYSFARYNARLSPLKDLWGIA